MPLRPPFLPTAVVERQEPAPAREAPASMRALLLGVLGTGVATVALWLAGIEVAGGGAGRPREAEPSRAGRVAWSGGR
jgi:hypothetical protein